MTYESSPISDQNANRINGLAILAGRTQQEIFSEALKEGLTLFRETPRTSSGDEVAPRQGIAQ